jgi:hypothetical protein
MKIEKRGKYAGVKVHLEPDEVEAFIALAADHKKGGGSPAMYPLNSKSSTNYFTLSVQLGKMVNKLMVEEPDLLKDRTPEQIKMELIEELRAAEEKLKVIDQGGDWKKIKVTVGEKP